MPAAGAVMVENCTFADDPGFFPLESRAGSSFYSDDPTLQLQVRISQFDSPKPLEAIPDPDAESPPLFLSRDDQWFAQLRNVRPSCYCYARNNSAPKFTGPKACIPGFAYDCGFVRT